MISLNSQIQKKVLGYFFLNETKDIYINALARLIDSDPKNVYRALLRLEAERILQSEFKGKQRYFRAYRDSSVYTAYRSLFMQTAGLEHQLRKALSKVKGLKEGYFFGSYGTKRFTSESDIDLLLIGEHSVLDAQKVLFVIQKQIGRDINPVQMTVADFKKQKDQKGSFVNRVFSANPTRIL